MRADYLSVAAGGQPVTGYGYFIALPSLHAAMSLLSVMAVRGDPFLVAVLGIPSILLLASTALVGQHYVLDLVSGAALGVWLGWRAQVTTPGAAAEPSTSGGLRRRESPQ